MIIPDKPCSECDNCTSIGGGEGLCDFPYKVKDKFIVNLFDVESNCPKMKWIEEKRAKHELSKETHLEERQRQVDEFSRRRWREKCHHKSTVALNEEGNAGIYCVGCVGWISRRTPSEYAIQYPAKSEGKGTCRGCDKEVELCGASKVVRK